MSDAAPQAAESGVESDDLNNTTIVMVGLVSTALVLASALGVKALYQAYVGIDSAQKAQAYSQTAVDSWQAEQDTTLHGAPHEIAGQPGVYSMPIERAMKLVVQDLSAGGASAPAEEAPEQESAE